MKEVLLIGARRTGYSPMQCGKTMTVGELISALSELSDMNEDMPVFISNDNGYTYGQITEWGLELKEFDDEEDEE